MLRDNNPAWNDFISSAALRHGIGRTYPAMIACRMRCGSSGSLHPLGTSLWPYVQWRYVIAFCPGASRSVGSGGHIVGASGCIIRLQQEFTQICLPSIVF
jgi:hypothetical protein